ncbi:hypothetical protein QF117_02685 [Vibrio sp. YMD68]|uniref:hypothetical protein n=1 Tax=Vibrio sp. YMD68 TaxID=3042300 RepID=UPI00249CEED9|nr:hypothetical protein [Vibrio sp. YMD68]WGV98885.1 hypothetical protein QF117_02685 [Vibrio sp. YMD68]
MVTPERFIEMAWTLELSICSLTKETTPADYLDRCEVAAVKHGIAVYTLDFALYESPKIAFAAEENRDLVSLLELCGRKTLVIFKNAEALAPLECHETFWLRSLLTCRNETNLLSVFELEKEAIYQMAQVTSAPFYDSMISI